MSTGLIFAFCVLYVLFICVSFIFHIDDDGYDKVYEIIGTRNTDKWGMNDWVLILWVSIFWPIPLLFWIFTGKRIIVICKVFINFFLFLFELIFFPFLFLFRFFKKKNNKNTIEEPFADRVGKLIVKLFKL
jgi:hypothetical protein